MSKDCKAPSYELSKTDKRLGGRVMYCSRPQGHDGPHSFSFWEWPNETIKTKIKRLPKASPSTPS
jgi:hypothetical protein